MKTLRCSEKLIMVCLIAASNLPAVPPEDSEEPGPSEPSDVVDELACGNGIVVRLSHNGEILTSKDGKAWVEHRLGIRTFLRAVTFGAGVFVAVGGSYVDVPGVIVTSHDGVNWVRRHPKNTISLHGVTYGNGLLVAVGDAGTIVTSHDGACWKNRPSGTSMALAAIAFGNGIFVAGGESGTILTSTNGLSWVNQNLGDSVYVGKVVFREGTFLATDAHAVFNSIDGRLWSRCQIDTAKTP
jgi:hypothetical protein